jgi:alkyl hydroperoxide reductase subunit AhpC
VIKAMEITAEGIGRDAEDLLRKVKAAQYVAAHPGEVCPAKWKEGEATLAPSWTWSARSKPLPAEKPGPDRAFFHQANAGYRNK